MRCSRCRQWLPSEAFTPSAARRRASGFCAACLREYCRAHYAQNKSAHNRRRHANHVRNHESNRVKLVEFLLAHPCVDCGESDPVVLEFDHRADKRYDIGRMIVDRTWESVEREIAKCDVRCVNCHRRKTAQQFKWFKGGDAGA